MRKQKVEQKNTSFQAPLIIKLNRFSGLLVFPLSFKHSFEIQEKNINIHFKVLLRLGFWFMLGYEIFSGAKEFIF